MKTQEGQLRGSEGAVTKSEDTSPWSRISCRRRFRPVQLVSPTAPVIFLAAHVTLILKCHFCVKSHFSINIRYATKVLFFKEMIL